MKRAVIAYILAFCLLLGGCSMGFEGDYIWQQSHPLPNSPSNGLNVSVTDYNALYNALGKAVEAAMPQLTLTVSSYDRDAVAADAADAVAQLRQENAIAAYALQNVHWEMGSVVGEQVLVFQFAYSYDQAHIRRIKTVDNTLQAKNLITSVLTSFESGIVLRIQRYKETDFREMLAEYIDKNPHLIIEAPEISVSIYPESGNDRVVELKFTYLTSRDNLRTMQQQVAKVVDGAVDIVSVTDDSRGKYAQMYSLLTERVQNYTLETSLTPAYSLLLYGVGDSKAFASVYAAMCRKAGLECLMVVGTYEGEVRYWNIVRIDGIYYHVDLLRSKEEGQFRDMTDEEMEGYVWYFPAYPTCGPRPVEPTPPEPTDTAPQA